MLLLFVISLDLERGAGAGAETAPAPRFLQRAGAETAPRILVAAPQPWIILIFHKNLGEICLKLCEVSSSKCLLYGF